MLSVWVCMQKNTMVRWRHALLCYDTTCRFDVAKSGPSPQVVEKQAALAALQAQVNGATLASATNRGLIVDMQARAAMTCRRTISHCMFKARQHSAMSHVATTAATPFLPVVDEWIWASQACLPGTKGVGR